MSNIFNLAGKTALVTGASSGLGEQFAHCLSNAGARVILAARRLDKLQNLATKLDNALAINMNIADKASVQKTFEHLQKTEEKIDICINAAGIAKETPVFELDKNNEFESIIQTNLMGIWYVTQAAAIQMKAHAIHGSIINISSINGANRLTEKISGYCASKAAVMQLTKENIRINCIVPGLFHTPLTQERLNTETGRETIEKLIPLDFVAEPHDLDGAILYLASNKASRYVTGSCLTIDGGISWGG